MECEYGSSPNPECNEIETCESNGLWSYPPPGVACIPGTCPATYADVPQGKQCTPQGLDCSYTEGQCNCSSTLPASGPYPVWQCSTPAAGCPEPRPRIGSPAGDGNGLPRVTRREKAGHGPHTLGRPPPPQICGAVQLPQWMTPPHPSPLSPQS